MASRYGTPSRRSSSGARRGSFAQRHDHGKKLGHEEVLEEAMRVGLDVDAVKPRWSGRPLKTLAAEHLEGVERWSVFGVPTYCPGRGSRIHPLYGTRPRRRPAAPSTCSTGPVSTSSSDEGRVDDELR
jgi:hypothetical protein